MLSLSMKATVVQVVKHMLCKKSMQQTQVRFPQLFIFYILQTKALNKIPPKTPVKSPDFVAQIIRCWVLILTNWVRIHPLLTFNCCNLKYSEQSAPNVNTQRESHDGTSG